MKTWNKPTSSNTSTPGGATNLNDLSDVAIATPVAGQIIKYDGSTFVNGANNIDASQVTSGTLDYARLPPLNISEGVTPPFISSVSAITPSGNQDIEILGSGFLPATNLSIPGATINSLSIPSPIKIIANIDKEGLSGNVPVILANGENTNLIWADSIKSKRVGDPYLDLVPLLLEGYGTIITDSAVPANTLSIAGCSISTDQYIYNNSSILINGQIATGSNQSLAVGSADYTAEAWIRPTASSATYRVIMQMGGNYEGLILHGSSLAFYYGSAVRLTHPTPLITDTWNHVVLQRASGVTSLFLNGIRSSTISFAYNSANAIYRIGSWSANSINFQGYMSHLRLTKIARYLNNFDPNDTRITFLNM